MPVALDFGGTPVSLGELQNGVEDFTISQSTEFAVEHDHQGRHSKPLASLEVAGETTLSGTATLGEGLDIEGEFALSLTANTHNLAQADGLPIVDAIIRVQGTAEWQLTGIKAPTSGRAMRILENGGTFSVIIPHASTSSLAANRISCPGDEDYELLSGSVIWLKYDPHSVNWRIFDGTPNVTMFTQRDVVLFTNGGPDTVNATLSTAIDMDTAQLRYLGTAASVAMEVRIALTSTTNVQCIRASAFNGAEARVSFEVSGRAA